MDQPLDIGPLRSLVAVADCGGFSRAADRLHLSQAGVSQHVRRLESAIGLRLVERHGRGSRFTVDGERLLEHARRILAAHDAALEDLVPRDRPEIVIGSTEHAAAQLLPVLAASLRPLEVDHRFRYRIDRGARLREDLAAGRIDVALLLNVDDDPHAVLVGDLELSWLSAPGWRRPAGDEPVPIVAFDEPCALRLQARRTLADHEIASVVVGEATQLAGVQAAVRAGIGVAPVAALGQVPDGLVLSHELPPMASLRLQVCSRPGTPAAVVDAARAGLGEHLRSVPGISAPTLLVS